MNEEELKKTANKTLYVSIVMFVLFLLGFLSDGNLIFLSCTLFLLVCILIMIFIRKKWLK